MKGLLALARRIYHGYVANEGALTAAAISYYALVSTVPLLLLSISLLGFVLGAQDRGFAAMSHLISQWVPSNTQDVDVVLGDIHAQRDTTGIIGLVVLLWIGSQFFQVLEHALNRTWSVSGNRPFWKGRLMAIGLMSLCGGLLLCSLALEIPAHWLESRRIPWSREMLAHLPFLWALVALLGPTLFSIITFFLIYRIVPTCNIPWREALAGATFAGLLWEMARLSFGYYVSHYARTRYSLLYGSLGGMALLVFWTYYTANILVLGGEFARAWNEIRSPKKPVRQHTAGAKRRPRPGAIGASDRHKERK